MVSWLTSLLEARWAGYQGQGGTSLVRFEACSGGTVDAWCRKPKTQTQDRGFLNWPGLEQLSLRKAETDVSDLKVNQREPSHNARWAVAAKGWELVVTAEL